MSERDRDLSRRGFLKLSVAAAAAVALPKALADIDGNFQNNLPGSDIKLRVSPNASTIKKEYQTERKEELQDGPRIIETIGINNGQWIFDIEADKTLIRENILSRAEKMVSPKLFPEVESKVDKLTISFGSRRLSDVLETEVGKESPLKFKNGTSLGGWALSRIDRILDSGEMYGGTAVTDIKEPLIYLNMSHIYDWGSMRHFWDHETAHLIYNSDPKKSESSLERYIKMLAIDSLMAATAGAGATLTACDLYTKFKNIDTRSFIEKNEDRIRNYILTSSAVAMIPLMGFAEDIRYYYFDESEVY